MRSVLASLAIILLMDAVVVRPADATQVVELLSGNTPVFSEHQEHGDPEGYSIDFARSILKMASLQVSTRPMPFARLIKEMESGELMVATGVGRTPQREDKYFWLTPITANVVGLYGKSPIDLDRLSAKNQTITVAVMRGDYRAELGEEYPQFDMREYNTWAQAIGAVLMGRADSVFFSEFGVSVICRNAGLDCSAIERQLTHNVLYSYIVMPKTEPNRALAAVLSEHAKRFVRTPEFDRMVNRWMPEFKAISKNVDEVEGVITLGKIERSDQDESPLWVITNEEPLFSELNERGQLSGYAVDLVRSILMEAGKPSDILTAPWQRILVESALKPDVLVFSLARTEERENQFHWITPITQNAYSVFALRDNPNEAESLDALPASSRIAVLKNDFRQHIIKGAGHVAIPAESWPDAVRMLAQGRADYVFFSDGGMSVICDQLGHACRGITKLFVHQELTTYLALSKPGTDQALINKLVRAANTFKASKGFENLVENWITAYAKQSSLALQEHDGVLVLGNPTSNKDD